MNPAPDPSPAARLQAVAARPARLVAMIGQMILGTALAVALVLKAYMAVLTDHVCVAEAPSLGNLMRCSPTLELMAGVLALSAGLDLARSLFAEGLARAHGPLVLSLASAVLYLLAGFQAGAGWREALVLVALVAAMGGVMWLGAMFAARPK